MRQRLEMLRRLVSLYAVVEEMHSSELQRMTAAVRETEHAIVMEQDVAKSAWIDGRGALAMGDRVGWLISEVQQKTAGGQRQRLEQVLQEREQLNDTAKQQYMASRLRREQVKGVLDEIAARIEIEDERRTQSASDDRFLARLRWSNSKEKMSVNREMKDS
jgi:hypothetical protein